MIDDEIDMTPPDEIDRGDNDNRGDSRGDNGGHEERGDDLLQANGRWSFRTATDLGDRLRLEKLVPRKLSRAAIETLAIVAYHQPVTRAEIEEIRGVIVSRGILDTLMESSWIRPKGH